MEFEPEDEKHLKVIDTIVESATIKLSDSKLSQTSPEAARLSRQMRTDISIVGVPNTEHLKRFCEINDLGAEITIRYVGIPLIDLYQPEDTLRGAFDKLEKDKNIE